MPGTAVAAGMRLLPVALVALLLLPAVAFAAPASTRMLPQEGPDVPTTTPAIAVVTAFDDERWSFTEGVRTHTLAVPPGEWDRVVLVLTVTPDGDPWDRLVNVAIEGVEVLRAVTPRTEFTLRRDVTEFASLLPAGGEADVSVRLGTWVGAMKTTVALEFYEDPDTASLVAPAVDHVLPVTAFHYLGGDGSATAATVAFPVAEPSRAVLHFHTSGHGANGEFFYLSDRPAPPTFRVYVDGVDVGHATAMPYVYALLGFGGQSVVNDLLHRGMWWTGQQALDVAGVYTGTGEIPAYRAELPAEALPLLTGAREVRLVQEGGYGSWISSLSVLVDE